MTDAIDRMAYLMARQLDRERRDGTITLAEYHEEMRKLRDDRDAARAELANDEASDEHAD